MENASTRSLIDEYNRLQILAQAAMIAGDRGGESVQKLQRSANCCSLTATPRRI
jgi:hypothetical protein